jgi:hypothetical protein
MSVIRASQSAGIAANAARDEESEEEWPDVIGEAGDLPM